jgi:hypothetical protein
LVRKIAEGKRRKGKGMRKEEKEMEELDTANFQLWGGFRTILTVLGGLILTVLIGLCG